MTSACPACSAAPLAMETASGPAMKFSVPTVHCAACIGKIERGLAHLNGVQAVRVNLSMKRLSVTGDVDPDDVMNAVEDLGFEVFALDTASLQVAQDSVGRGLLMRMAVAGFAMMNVMLFSVAIWSGATDATRDLFHLISAAITLPVVLYSGQPFFQSAWSALRVRRLNMDVPISLAILLASAMSLFETLQGGTEAYFDAALSLTFFLLIGRYMDYRTRSAARSAARELTALEVHTAERLVGEQTYTVPVAELEVGDVILVPTGGRVAVDGVLLSGDALMDRSVLTGESAAVTLHTGDMLQAGEINLTAPLRLRAMSVGADTSLRRMAALVETAENARNSYTALADRAAQIYAPAVHTLALVALLGWWAATGDFRHALNIAIAVLIITCPCALGLAVPAVSTAAVSRLFNAGFLVRHATALERLAEVTRIVFDKTGTLTRPTVQLPDSMSEQDKSIAKALAQTSFHPLSRALLNTLKRTTAAQVSDITEIAGQGVRGTFEGQIVQLGRGPWLEADHNGLCLRVGDADAIALEVPEALRAGVADAIGDLDLPCEIVTGDTELPAKALAEKLSLPVISNATPQTKIDRLKALSAEGEQVLMVGDGLNDTAALAQAHASIAPSTALEASRNAADIVILKDSFAELPLIVNVARATRRLSQQNFAIAAVYNCIAVPIALAGFATPLAAALAMSLSSLTVLANAQRMRFIR
ncbi:heavy metal translocating P-type ATPase [Sulfitobacter donghicola]|uniref:ATPase n=1 Tax=Sulfitobacter donghicola DSW-25 = KCTC 12864 = JCM 14565 TaxID=1300350 RepID=A0A073IEI8_9RHOB|nr:heavy metal translocating P-type ATPase [Sulfitobacter donghicola]KEJ87901.1 ATPase [Sulfitobacter donghicola DSW-25 = KCTC 12864 = JCM 14565]KIN67252.1 Nitrogen fixation protein FixI [Sulfitobacter donghicola DSW-25 = KCTC 12864 = JCM 14565]